MRSHTIRHNFRYQRNSASKLSPHAKPSEKSVKAEVPEVNREGTQSCETRIEGDGEHHRPDPADAIAKYPKHQPSQCPTNHEDSGRMGPKLIDARVIRCGIQKL